MPANQSYFRWRHAGYRSYRPYPAKFGATGGFKAQGRTAATAVDVIADARAVQEAGAFALLVEAVPPEVCKFIRDELKIPVYSIGAGVHADGQLTICSDLLGMFQAFTPKFIKRYENLAERATQAFSKYAEEVRNHEFPQEQHTYKMVDGEFEKLLNLLK